MCALFISLLKEWALDQGLNDDDKPIHVFSL